MIQRRDGVSLTKMTIVGLIVAFVIYLVLRNGSQSQDINYAVVLDAGSTGSRVHIYLFRNKEILDEIFVQVKPGLSSYADNAEEAAQSLKTLLETAKKNVPAKIRKCTPLFLRATAGLRLLPGNKSQKILESVHSFMSTYGFYMPKDAVDIMGGEDEGVYAWITVNYLLGRFSSDSKKPTVGIMDLGGGSTQIVFEPKSPSVMKLAPKENKFSLHFGRHSYSLYQNSYLGYGLMEARKKIKILSRDNFCLPDGFKDELKSDNGVIRVEGNGGTFSECSNHVVSILEKNKPCGLDECSFAGVYQPSFEQFPEEIYAFSYFYDTTELMDPAFPSVINGNSYLNEARRVCGRENSTTEKNPHICLDLTFIYNLLTEGYGIPANKEIVLAKKISGFETGWCLGAAIKVLESMDNVCDE